MNITDNNKQIKCIIIEGKEYHNKVYGNSYQSSLITIVFKDNTTEFMRCPIEYGYGSFYFQEASKKVNEHLNLGIDPRYFSQYCSENDIYLHSIVHASCSKKEVKTWGN